MKMLLVLLFSVNCFAAGADQSYLGRVSLGNPEGKTNIGLSGSVATSAVTADQVVKTYSVTSGKNLFLQYFDVAAKLGTYASTATDFGTCSLESPAGTKLYSVLVANGGAPLQQGRIFPEPLVISSGVVVRIVCTPAASTAFVYQANIGGYER